MREINLLCVEIHNFRSIREQVVDFGAPSIPGFKFLGGINEVEPRLGPNGSGKTSLWEAICWCCFGRSTRGARTSQVISWGAESVAVSTFWRINGDVCVIKRGGPPERIYLNDNEAAPMTQQDIEHLLGLNYDQFLHCVIFGQGRPLFPDLKIAERSELLDQVLNLELWNQCSEVASKRQKAADLKLRGVEQARSYLNGQIATIPNDEILLDAITAWELRRKEDMTAIQARLQEWEQGRACMLAEARAHADVWEADKRRRIEENEHADKQWHAERDAQLDALGAQLEAEESARDLIAEPASTAQIEREVQAKTHQVRQQEQLVNQLHAAVATLQTRRRQQDETIQDLLTAKNCRTCGQLLPQDNSARVAELRGQVVDTQKELESKIGDRAAEQTRLAILQNEIRELTAQNASTLTAVALQRTKKDNAVAKVAATQERIRQLVREIEAGSRFALVIASITREMNPHDRNIAAMEREENPYTGSLQTCRETINPKVEAREVANRQRVKLTQEWEAKRDEQLALEALMAKLEYWKGAFKRIRLFYVGQVLAALEIEIQAAISVHGLDGWRIKLMTETENKSGTTKLGVQIRVLSQSGQEGEWETWSGGEGQRLRLAMAEGLASLIQRAAGVWFDVEVWDEPSAWLSTEGVDDLLEALQYRAQSLKKSIWLIDHRSLAFSGFSEIWTARKFAEGTKVYCIEGDA